MAPSNDSTWRSPAFPREVASSVVASVQHVTSSVRLLLIGCFQCQSLRAGCWRRQEENDGAWFDCEKLQVEHPFCYVNPVALTEPVSSSVPPAPPERRLSASSDVSGGGGGPTSLVGGGPPPPSGAPTSYSNGGPKLANGLPKVHKNGDVFRSGGLVESFAAKLEADIRKLEYDRQRSEGEVVLRGQPEGFEVLELPDYLRNSTGEEEEEEVEGEFDLDFFRDIQVDYRDDDGGLARRRLEAQEVWQPSELEDAFECYNMAAFYSYGAPSGGRQGSKHRGEKFEEVFPVTFHNNNTIKVYKPASESESPLALPTKDEIVIENETNTSSVQRKRTATEGELKEFIRLCVFAENFSEVHVPCTKGASICDDNIYYCSKSFNKHLIYNLVKSTMSECSKSYSQSIAVCVNYPVHLVQSKVLSVLEDQGNKNEPIPSGLQVFRSNVLLSASDKLFYENQLMAERLIENVVVDELKKEDKLWQNVSQEETELKEAITSEIFDDLIGDTASLLESILAKKLT